MSPELALPTGHGPDRIAQMTEFASQLEGISQQIGFKVSARGWAYILEQSGLITKAEFDRIESLINEMRRLGLLPVDFVAEETARAFSGVEEPDDRTPESYLAALLRGGLKAQEYYTPDWWDGEKYYIQMVVEKIDLKTLFEPVCQKYHIPIATSKGWSSILQRADYARRYKEAEDQGLQCVLLYAGDHDPDGLRISEFLRSNLFDIADIRWGDGTHGYDPSDLKITRFGLNYDFIQKHHLTWIDNLITGSGRNLASPAHKNHHLPYVQEYLQKIGARKCEANALVVSPAAARQLCETAIALYLGIGSDARFEDRRQKIRDKLAEFDKKTGYGKALKTIIKAAEAEPRAE